MKKKNKIILSVFIGLLLSGLLWVKQEAIIDYSLSLSIQLLIPDEAFNKENMVAAPDYAETKYWASLPEREDESDISPEGIGSSVNNGTAPVDVFYIHGTGFTSSGRWTSPMNTQSATADNLRFSLANQASIFNGCCNIYAPHYREASIFTYVAMSHKERDRVLAAVYPDVARAFKYFVQHLSNNRPFIIVSHSQGTHHALKLVKDAIDSTPLSNNLVAAYMIGGIMKPVSNEYLSGLKTLSACQRAEQTGCIIHWDTFGVGGAERIFKSDEKALCVNPLTWTNDEQLADKTLHLGALPISGSYTMRPVGEDSSEQVSFQNPGALMPEYTQAQCIDGTLYVDDMSSTKYNELGSMKDHSLHGIDFSLFHMNIRQNVEVRIRHFLNNKNMNSRVQ